MGTGSVIHQSATRTMMASSQDASESLDRRQKHQNARIGAPDQTGRDDACVKFLLSLMYLLGFFALISTIFSASLLEVADNGVYFIIRNFESLLRLFFNNMIFSRLFCYNKDDTVCFVPIKGGVS